MRYVVTKNSSSTHRQTPNGDSCEGLSLTFNSIIIYGMSWESKFLTQNAKSKKIASKKSEPFESKTVSEVIFLPPRVTQHVF